ncbi:ParB/RepB/Spo0J family partition protein [Comamonas jiangduensis]|uniref:ParB/RepB/Spo0J family partition protein n=1 Tax=Comamonas jiangduensis TaxID=1194168 RepID=UPI003BF81947
MNTTAANTPFSPRSISELASIASRTRQSLNVSVDDLVSEAQVRKSFTGLQELGETMKSDGQIQPIIVKPKNRDGKYVITKGERRWRAAKLVGLKTVDIIVDTRITSDVDAIYGQVIENELREPLTAMELAETVEVLISNGESQKNIAARIKKHPTTISMLAGMQGMPQHLRDIGHANPSIQTEVLYLLSRIYKLDAKAYYELFEKYSLTADSSEEEKPELTRPILRQTMAQLNPSKKATAAAAAGENPGEQGAKTATMQAGAGAGSDNGEGGAGGTAEKATANSGAVKPKSKPAGSADTTTVATKPDDKHKQPSATVVHTNFKAVTADKLAVSFIYTPKKGEEHEVLLMLDRAANDAENVWIKMPTGTALEVPAATLKFLRVDAFA